MNFIDITPGEVACGKMEGKHLEQAVEALRVDGFVVLNDVVDVGHVEVLRGKMLEDVERILAREDAPYNFNRGNVQQDPPPFAPYLFRDVLVNDVVAELTCALLGEGVKNAYYSGNTALPSEGRQPVHPDAAQLWSGMEWAPPAFGVVVNVPVVDMEPENGSTELWPGTHLDTTYSLADKSVRIPEEMLAPWREERPPVQPSVRRGSVVLRDIRLWHAGMPNCSREARPMIAMIHWCRWWNSRPVIFEKGTEEIFEHSVLATDARFVEGPIDYINRNAAYDLQDE